jgi:hypothetical protein
MEQDEIRQIAGASWHPSLPECVPIRINKAALEYDHILILGPTFPHEVVGFSGGAKYLFPGISGAEMINVTHWLGALITTTKSSAPATPRCARSSIAPRRWHMPTACFALVVTHAKRRLVFRIGCSVVSGPPPCPRNGICGSTRQCQVLSAMPEMYSDVWTAGKGMLDRARSSPTARGRIYTPHIRGVSYTHKLIGKVYHCRDCSSPSPNACEYPAACSHPRRT